MKEQMISSDVSEEIINSKNNLLLDISIADTPTRKLVH